jgi:NADP-dependent 3-hydroxy acid dehydrogenase YdfG
MQEKRLVGKVAVVTGASSGIGEATAIALASEGAKVAVVARRVERLEALVEKIMASGGQAFSYPADIAHESEVKATIDQILADHGQVDILVNNAGVMLLGSIDGADTEEWRRMVNVNLLGLIYAVHAVLPAMKSQQSGHIVNISSVAGRYVIPTCAIYCATKWGVCAFSEGLRQETVKDKIRVTLIEPGGVSTELIGHTTDRAAKQWLEDFEQKVQFLRSEDIANAILYAVTQSAHVSVNELLIRPANQEL